MTTVTRKRRGSTAAVLSALRIGGTGHGDLHDGNLMRRREGKGAEAAGDLVVIDFDRCMRMPAA